MDPSRSSLFQLVTGGSNLFQLALRFSMHVYYVNIWTTNDTLVLQIWHRILNASIITLLNKTICNMFHCLTTTFKFSFNQERKQTSKHYKYCRFTKNVFTAYFQSFSLNFFNNHAKWRNETQVSKKRFIKKYYLCNKACQLYGAYRAGIVWKNQVVTTNYVNLPIFSQKTWVPLPKSLFIVVTLLFWKLFFLYIKQ